jgi:hypothetical protein
MTDDEKTRITKMLEERLAPLKKQIEDLKQRVGVTGEALEKLDQPAPAPHRPWAPLQKLSKVNGRGYRAAQ